MIASEAASGELGRIIRGWILETMNVRKKHVQYTEIQAHAHLEAALTPPTDPNPGVPPTQTPVEFVSHRPKPRWSSVEEVSHRPKPRWSSCE